MSINSHTPPQLNLLVGTTNRKLVELKPLQVRIHHEVNRIPWAEISLSIQNLKLAKHEAEVKLCQTSSAFKITTANGEVLFDGVITKLSHRIDKQQTLLNLHIKHRLQGLKATYRSQVFEKITDGEIVRSLCKSQNIILKSISGLHINHPQMIQFRSSDWHFLLTRLQANGVWLYPLPNELSIKEPKISGTAHHTLTSSTFFKTSEQGAVEEANWQFNIINQSPKLTVTSWDINHQKKVSSSGQSPLLGARGLDPNVLKALNNIPQNLTYSENFLADEIKALAKGKLLEQRSEAITGSFTVLGSTAYKIGQTLQLSGFGSVFDGMSIITAVQHVMKQGYWRTILQLGQKDQAINSSINTVPSIKGMHIGIVDSYQQDSEGWNRIRITLPTLFETNNSLWARFSSPYASNQKGFCFYPEPGDEVVVGFFDDDPRYPVILGAMYNPKNQPPYPVQTKNDNKAMVFDKEKKQQLLFNVADKKTTLVSGEDSIVINQGMVFSSDKAIETSSQNLKFKANQNITIEGKSSVQVKASKVDLSN